MTPTNLVIVIAHYNNPIGLEDSIASINENIPIDIIIVDDGSNNKFNERKLIDCYTNGKLFFDYLKSNSGVGIASNKGLNKAISRGYKYIGRLDCGDLCKKDKFNKQIEYLENNPKVKILGTWANILDKNHKFLYHLEHPINYEEIKKKMYFNSMFLNPSVVFCSEILEKTGLYPTKYKRNSEDYAFFFKAIKYYEAQNYPEYLMDYVITPNSLSSSKRKEQVLNRIRIIIDNFYIGYYPIVGLSRNIMLFFFSRKTTTMIKKIFKK